MNAIAPLESEDINAKYLSFSATRTPETFRHQYCTREIMSQVDRASDSAETQPLLPATTSASRLEAEVDRGEVMCRRVVSLIDQCETACSRLLDLLKAKDDALQTELSRTEGTFQGLFWSGALRSQRARVHVGHEMAKSIHTNLGAVRRNFDRLCDKYGDYKETIAYGMPRDLIEIQGAFEQSMHARNPLHFNPWDNH